MRKSIQKQKAYFLHGGDYNPEQWLQTPEILREDLRLMQKARCNTFSVGIFSWGFLEPEEGKFDFSFLDDILGNLGKIGVKVNLATPSAAMPYWLCAKYPEVMKVNADGVREKFGGRQNFCPTSPKYREKVREINEKLSARYGQNETVLLWHISNEYYGEPCYCELCKAKFREFLKRKYGTIERLNHEYWTAFWSHTYSSFEEIEPNGIAGLALDWRRFTSENYRDFMREEIAAVRKYSAKKVTTNMLPGIYELDYSRYADDLDVISFDNYPAWHSPGHLHEAAASAFWHDFFRSLKNAPYLLMESSPGLENWKQYNKLKESGMDKLASMQAAAHGSDGVLYFQWRKSRGDAEKFHGAVVDHEGSENTRIFKAVQETGETLEKIAGIAGTGAKRAEVAILFDWENMWAFERSQFAGRKNYRGDVIEAYKFFWNNAIPCDVKNPRDDLSGYKLVIAVDLYMVDKAVEENLLSYVQGGGTLYAKCFLGMANENDLCHLGGFPAGKLKEVFGIWNEELDTLYPGDERKISADGKEYAANVYEEHIHARSANVFGKYTDGMFAGEPCFTENAYGNGTAYYQAFACENGEFESDAFERICKDLGIESVCDGVREKPLGVTAHMRTDEKTEYLFIENYTDEQSGEIALAKPYEDMETGEKVTSVNLPRFGVRILKAGKNG